MRGTPSGSQLLIFFRTPLKHCYAGGRPSQES
jgi:hypothetical protein